MRIVHITLVAKIMQQYFLVGITIPYKQYNHSKDNHGNHSQLLSTTVMLARRCWLLFCRRESFLVLAPFLHGGCIWTSLYTIVVIRCLILLFFAMSAPNPVLLCAICWRESSRHDDDDEWSKISKDIIIAHLQIHPATGGVKIARSQNSGQKSHWNSLRFVYTEKLIVDDAGWHIVQRHPIWAEC